MDMQSAQTILIADSDQKFVRTIKTMLELYGYSVATANSGEKALDLLAEEEFDLIISELKMSGPSGIELLEEIQKKGIGSPVIFLTEYGEVESYLRVMNMGAFDYLNKSLQAKDILRVIRHAIKTAGVCHVSPG